MCKSTHLLWAVGGLLGDVQIWGMCTTLSLYSSTEAEGETTAGVWTCSCTFWGRRGRINTKMWSTVFPPITLSLCASQPLIHCHPPKENFWTFFAICPPIPGNFNTTDVPRICIWTCALHIKSKIFLFLTQEPIFTPLRGYHPHCNAWARLPAHTASMAARWRNAQFPHKHYNWHSRPVIFFPSTSSRFVSAGKPLQILTSIGTVIYVF